ncbi:type I-F CRISPR-associated protein Csy1 [uncultured Agitococcus sp.]|uniref:type I-F CRISPR-associated protein Csy1 n=1 Tax=uncultured Agitococcus sp. TaxID=1506599 RepID=UPI002630803F|nr:type I-F CRISPR-associated protein Csy1 [uncultured Agitococcus sp.]
MSFQACLSLLELSFRATNDSEVIKPILTINTANYDELKQGFISIKQADSSIKTDRLVKQVYFPVVENYHLLSILTPSGLLTKIKTTIDKMRFSDESKEAKAQRKDNKYHPTGFDDLLDLSVTAYGGTQPQNISVLNSQNAGRAYLLPSTPPTLQKRDIRLPTYDFFKNSLWRGQFKDNFDALHKLMILDINNINIREAINRRIKFVIDQILEKAFVIRASNIGWSETEHYKQLPLAQRIWLDDIHLEQRTNQELWLEAVSRSFAGWIVHSYEASQKNNGAIILSSTESNHIRQFVEEAISQDKEFF